MRTSWAGIAVLMGMSACARHADPSTHHEDVHQGTRTRIRILADQVPLTLNPRFAQDAIGQRLGALLFRALVKIAPDLDAVPDLASSWRPTGNGKAWEFTMAPVSTDHGGEPIDAKRMTECLEQYREGKPTSRLKGAFPHWLSTSNPAPGIIRVELSRPDPYLPRNLTLLRYFRTKGGICAEPAPGEPLIASGAYRPSSWQIDAGSTLGLDPVGPPERSPLAFVFARDDSTRVMKLLLGEADAAQNSISLTRTRWLGRAHGNRFRILERDGVNTSYLAFNLRAPGLRDPRVRRALALAIDRESIVRHKLMGFGQVAGSLLAPSLTEARQNDFPFDPAAAGRLLEEAGLARGADGTRLRLRMKTTPVREGIETALMIREQLGKVGVAVDLDVVEPGVFLESVKRGAFELYASRWAGVADASILLRIAHSKGKDNRAGYASPELDQVLDAMGSEVDPVKRIALAGKAQDLLARDLPYFPLWRWSNALVLARSVDGLSAEELSLSGGLGPLTKLQWIEGSSR